MRKNPVFHSILGDMLQAFVTEKNSLGLSYIADLHNLERLDQMIIKEDLHVAELPRSVFEKWIGLFAHVKSITLYQRAALFRKFALFLQRHGMAAYVPDTRLLPIPRKTYAPYVFTHDQIRRLFLMVDHLRKRKHMPFRHIIMPTLFRLLYCCGLRVGEALRLKVNDINFDTRTLTIRQTKFGKDRLVIMPTDLTKKMQKCHNAIGRFRAGHEYFFPSPNGGGYSPVGIYLIFRKLLKKMGMKHGGRGQGPRLHDLRTTFAVHRMMAWYREGDDLHAKLPVLSAFMGHRGLAGTERYLFLTMELFTDVTTRFEKQFGDVVPRGGVS